MAIVTVVITEVAEATDPARAVMGQDHPASAVWVVVVVGVVRGSIKEPRAKVMPMGEPKASAVECRTGVKGAPAEYRTAGSEAAAMERRAAASETAAMKGRAAAVHSTAAMEPASATTVETTTSAVASATTSPTVASATSATTDFGRHPPGRGFGDRCRARTNQRHRVGMLAWCGRQRQHRRRCKARAQDVTHRTACGA